MSIIVAFFLIGLDDAACELENPFGSDLNDLPLDGFTSAIRANLMDIKKRKVEKRRSPPPATPPMSVDKAAAAMVSLVKAGGGLGLAKERIKQQRKEGGAGSSEGRHARMLSLLLHNDGTSHIFFDGYIIKNPQNNVVLTRTERLNLQLQP